MDAKIKLDEVAFRSVGRLEAAILAVARKGSRCGLNACHAALRRLVKREAVPSLCTRCDRPCS